jgi:hypothetical protein
LPPRSGTLAVRNGKRETALFWSTSYAILIDLKFTGIHYYVLFVTYIFFQQQKYYIHNFEYTKGGL